MMYAYGTVVNIRRQYNQFDKNVETGVRSCLVRNVKKAHPQLHQSESVFATRPLQRSIKILQDL